MPKPEAHFKQALVKSFAYYPIWYLSIAPAFVKCPKCGFGFARHGIRPGVPDILTCYDGQFVGIEAKAGKNDLSAAQEEQKRLIELAGGKVIIARTIDDVVQGLGLKGRLF